MGTQSTNNNMAEEDNSQFEIVQSDAGASLTQSVESGSIRKGGYLMVKGKACKVRDVSTSKTGKHGHAKCKFSAVDIFTGATCEELCPASHNIDQPFVKKVDYSVMGMTDGFPQLMEDDGTMREDLPLPNNQDWTATDDDNSMAQKLTDYVQEQEDGANIEISVTVQQAIGKEKIIDVRK